MKMTKFIAIVRDWKGWRTVKKNLPEPTRFYRNFEGESVYNMKK